MDQLRQIRFLIPPVILLTSLFWGAWCDGTALSRLHDLLSGDAASIALKVIVGGGAALIAAGYTLGTITYCALRLFFCFKWYCEGTSKYHEALFSDCTLAKVWMALPREASSEERAATALYGVVAFDHGILRQRYPGIHDWLVRRWTGFTVAANSIVALLFSLWIDLGLGVRLSSDRVVYGWILPALIFGGLLCLVAHWSHQDGENMINFMATNPWPQGPKEST